MPRCGPQRLFHLPCPVLPRRWRRPLPPCPGPPLGGAPRPPDRVGPQPGGPLGRHGGDGPVVVGVAVQQVAPVLAIGTAAANTATPSTRRSKNALHASFAASPLTRWFCIGTPSTSHAATTNNRTGKSLSPPIPLRPAPFIEVVGTSPHDQDVRAQDEEDRALERLGQYQMPSPLCWVLSSSSSTWCSGMVGVGMVLQGM